MSFVIRLAQFLLSLGILVILHEFGHFLLAKIFKVRVEKFYIFFNPWFSLYKRKIGETEYGIGWLPLGGYVKLSGMVDESFDTEQLSREPQPWEFRSKPAWQRLLIILGGVFVNVLLAWVIYAGLLLNSGETYLATRDIKYGIAPDSLAREIGFRSGDRVLAVNGDTIENFAQVMTEALLTPDARVTVSRDGAVEDVVIPRAYLNEIINGETLFQLRLPFVVERVLEGSPAEQAGVLAGDSLVAIEGQPALFFDEFREAMQRSVGDTLAVTFLRGGEPVTASIVVPANGLAGIMAVGDVSRFFDVSRREYNLGSATIGGASRVGQTFTNYWNSIKLFFVPEAKAHQSLGGFIAIGKIFPKQWDWVSFWSLTAFLSIALAFFNVLPIPGLDGGHAFFILWEMVTRRKPSQQFMVRAQTIGFLLIIFLALYANLNDVVKLFQ